MFSPEAVFAVVPVWLTLVIVFLLPAVEPAVPVGALLCGARAARRELLGEVGRFGCAGLRVGRAAADHVAAAAAHDPR